MHVRLSYLHVIVALIAQKAESFVQHLSWETCCRTSICS